MFNFESYKHKCAKDVLAEWFTETENKCADFCKLAQFNWRVNYGVFKELEFYENNNPYYFEITPENNKAGKLLFVPDVCVFHKGTPAMLFEVVNKSDIRIGKIKKIEKFFNGFYIELYKIKADYILNQTCIPDNILCERII